MSDLPLPAVEDRADLGARPASFRQSHWRQKEWLLKVLRLWNVEKLSQAQIAVRLNVTISTVSGQIARHRELGFERRPARGNFRKRKKEPFVPKPKKSKFNSDFKLVTHPIAAAAPKKVEEPFVLKPKKSKFNPNFKLVTHPIAAAAPKKVEEPAVAVDEAAHKKQIWGLLDRDCRWPVEGKGHDMWYCGEIKSLEHRSYCVQHAKRAAR